MLALHQQKRKKSRSHRVSIARHFLGRKGKILSKKQWHRKHIKTDQFPHRTGHREAWLLMLSLLCTFKGHLNGALSLGRWGTQ